MAVRRRTGAAWSGMAAAICLAFLTGLTFAQAAGDSKEKPGTPVGEQPRSEKGENRCPATPTPATPAASAASATEVPEPIKPACGHDASSPAPADQTDATAVAGPERKPAADSTSPNKAGGARWKCDKLVVEVGPIWTGQPLACNFPIRNEGTEELVVRTKPG